MSSSTVSLSPTGVDDGVVSSSSSSSSSGPRAGGPRRRRSFTAAQKLEHVIAYEQALEEGQGGAYLRRHGLYSSLVSEWRRLRDAGLLEGKTGGEKIGRPSKEQAEIARLTRELAEERRKLATTETAFRPCPRGR